MKIGFIDTLCSFLSILCSLVKLILGNRVPCFKIYETFAKKTTENRSVAAFRAI